MSSQTMGIIIGGIIPAVLFGLSGVFAKASTLSGIGLGPYLLAVGFGAIVAAVGFYIFNRDATLSLHSGTHPFLVGLSWAVAAGLVVLALIRFGSPIAQLAPLYNMNALVTIVIALWMFSEWREVNLTRLLVGSGLILAGVAVVSKA